MKHITTRHRVDWLTAAGQFSFARRHVAGENAALVGKSCKQV
jgi:hypothetical protein